MSETKQEKGLSGVYFRWVHIFFVVATLIGGGMFFFKVYSFMRTIKKDELAGFAFDPIMIYAFVAIGFLFMLVWAYISGQFKDVERPKYEMLEKFEEQTRAEARQELKENGHVA